MSYFEDKLLRNRSGSKTIGISILIGLMGMLPLLLYIGLGPKDGNPIGLGLLAIVIMPIAGIGIFVGVIKILARHFDSHKE